MIENLESYYLKLITQQLHIAHSSLQQACRDEQFLLRSLQLVTGDTPEQHKFHILTLLHSALRDTWHKQQFFGTVKDDFRSGLLHAFVQNYEDLRLASAFAHIFKFLVAADGAAPWIEPLKQLVSWMDSQEIKIIEAGLEVFLVVFGDGANTELYKLADALLTTLFNIFATELNENQRQKVLILVLLVIKTFSGFDGSKDDIVQECFKNSYDIWMSLFVSALQSNVKTHINMKRYILKSLTVIFRDMLKYSAKSLNTSILPIWQFCYKVISIYVWQVVFNFDIDKFEGPKTTTNQSTSLDTQYLDEDEPQGQSPVQLLAHQCLQFISTLISLPALVPIMNVSVYHVISAVFHYMLLTSFDVSNWHTNVHQFIAFTHNTEESPTIRQKGLNILNEMIERYGDLALQGVLIVCEKFMQGGDNIALAIDEIYAKQNIAKFALGVDSTKLASLIKHSTYKIKCRSYDWRKVQITLAVLGRFSQDIIVFQSKSQSSFDINSFFLNLITQINNPNYNPILRGQSLLCVTRYCQIISIKFKDLLEPLFKASLLCCHKDNQLPVRMIGIKSLNIFGRKLEKHKIEISVETLNKYNIVEQILSIEPTPDTISIILEGIIQLSKLNLTHSIAAHSDYLLSLFHMFNTSHTVFQQISTLLNNLVTRKENMPPILQHFGSFISQCIAAYTKVISCEQKAQLKEYDKQLITSLLKMLNIFIINGRELVFPIVSLLPSMLNKNDDTTIHVEATICLKTFIKVATPQILKRDFTKDILNIINKLIEVPKQKSFESASLYAGNLIILTFNNLLNGVGNVQVLKQLVLKVFKSRTPSIIQSLVLVYSRIINNCGDGAGLDFNKQKLSEVVDFLSSFSFENRMALKILIDKWLLQQSLFRGKFTKNATFMALSKLFMLKDKKIDNLLVIGFNPSHANLNSDVYAPLKILSTLIRCLDNQCQRQLEDKNISEEDFQQEIEQDQEKDSTQVAVDLDKFVEDKEDQVVNVAGGGLGDRENQGSTCYMSAMLEFYDDGEQCDETTEEDLEYLKDCSTTFTLGEYLKNFFQYLIKTDFEYLTGCLKKLLKEDLNLLNKYVKIKL